MRVTQSDQLLECQNILHHQIDLMDVLADDNLPVFPCSAMTTSPVCRQLVKLVKDSGGLVISSSQDMTKPANMALMQKMPHCPILQQRSLLNTRSDQRTNLMVLRSLDLKP